MHTLCVQNKNHIFQKHLKVVQSWYNTHLQLKKKKKKHGATKDSVFSLLSANDNSVEQW